MSRWGKEVAGGLRIEKGRGRAPPQGIDFLQKQTDVWVKMRQRKKKKQKKKKEARVGVHPKSLSYSSGNVFIYKQLEDKP